MKQFFKYIIILLLVEISASGCSKKSHQEDMARTTLNILSASIAEENNSYINTKAVSSSTLSSGDIGIFRLASDSYSTASNVEYSYASSSWSLAAGEDPIYLYGEDASVCAYYPFSSSIDNPTVIPLSSQLYSSSEDLCYAVPQTVSASSPSVSFSMERAYAKLSFVISHDNTYSGNCAISNITVSNAGILSSNTLDITQSSSSGGTEGIYGSGTAGNISVNPAISSISAGSSTTAAILMVPSTTALSENIVFSFSVDGYVLTAEINASDLGSSSEFEAGNNYILDVNITGSGLSISTGDTYGDGSADITFETANCYMIAPGKNLTIHVNIKGNGDSQAEAGTGLPVSHKAYSVGVLWQTYYDSGSNSGLITLSNFEESNQTVKITANDSQSGNAVIAAYDSDGSTILWSWHIWVTNYNPNTTPVDNGDIYTITNTNGAYIWMDRNIGATTTTPATTTTLGLLYQWGRKDPFPGANNYYLSENNSYTSLPIYNANGTVLTEESGTSGTGIKHEPAVATTSNKILNLKNSIKNPMIFYYGIYGTNIGYDWYTSTNDRQYQNDVLWGGADNTSQTGKTIFDPCPSGWRIPAWNGNTPWSTFTTDNFTWTDANYGGTYNGETFYPASGYRHFDSGAFYYVGLYGYYWSASASDLSTPEYSYRLYFGNDGTFTNSSYNRALGYSVRCVKE
jgi:hypothetical protein